MPPQRSVAAPASQPIGNIIAMAPARDIKLPPFQEDMPQAWFNQAEAYFRLHGVLLRAVGTDASAKEIGQGHNIHP